MHSLSILVISQDRLQAYCCLHTFGTSWDILNSVYLRAADMGQVGVWWLYGSDGTALGADGERLS